MGSLSLRCDAHCGDHLCGWKHFMEIDLAVGCTTLRFFKIYSPCLRSGRSALQFASRHRDKGFKFWEKNIFHERKDLRWFTKQNILTLPWAAYRGDFFEILSPWLPGVMHTAEINSAVGCTPQRLTPPWDAHRGDWLSKVCYTPLSQLWDWIYQRNRN